MTFPFCGFYGSTEKEDYRKMFGQGDPDNMEAWAVRDIYCMTYINAG